MGLTWRQVVVLVGWAVILIGFIVWTAVNLLKADLNAHPNVTFTAPERDKYSDVYVVIDRTGSILEADFNLQKEVIAERIVPSLGLGDSWTVYRIDAIFTNENVICDSNRSESKSLDMPRGLADPKMIPVGGPIHGATDREIQLINSLYLLWDNLDHARDSCKAVVTNLQRPPKAPARTEICSVLDHLQRMIQGRENPDAREAWLFIFSDFGQNANGRYSCGGYDFRGVHVLLMYPENPESKANLLQAKGYFHNAKVQDLPLLAATRTSQLRPGPFSGVPRMKKLIPSQKESLLPLLHIELWVFCIAVVLWSSFTWRVWRAD